VGAEDNRKTGLRVEIRTGHLPNRRAYPVERQARFSLPFAYFRDVGRCHYADNDVMSQTWHHACALYKVTRHPNVIKAILNIEWRNCGNSCNQFRPGYVYVV
jgi:hypothetical protein